MDYSNYMQALLSQKTIKDNKDVQRNYHYGKLVSIYENC